MKDFNKQPIERALYLDSQTGEPIKVIRLSDTQNLRYFGPSDSFSASDCPPILSEDLASRLIRIKDPRTLREFLGDRNLFQLFESFDPYPTKGPQEFSEYLQPNLSRARKPPIGRNI